MGTAGVAAPPAPSLLHLLWQTSHIAGTAVRDFLNSLNQVRFLPAPPPCPPSLRYSLPFPPCLARLPLLPFPLHPTSGGLGFPLLVLLLHWKTTLRKTRQRRELTCSCCSCHCTQMNPAPHAAQLQWGRSGSGNPSAPRTARNNNSDIGDGRGGGE